MATWDHVTSYKQDVSSSPRPIATNLGRLVTYGEDCLPTKSYDSLTRCSFEVTWQIKKEISLIWLGLPPPHLAGQQLVVKVTHPWSHMTLCSCGQVRSSDNLKTYYLLFHKTYNCQTLLSPSFSHDHLML